MSRNFIVRTDYKANGRDVLNKQEKMSRSFGRFATQLSDGNSVIGRSFGKVNKSINRVAMIGMAALAGSVAIAAREYVQFDQIITGANARFKDTVIGSKQAAINMQLLKDAAREVGSTTQFSATEAAAGLNFYAKAGFTTAEAMAVLADTVDLATAAEFDFNRAADISSDLLGALGKNVQDSAQKIQNLKDINRALGLTANSANVDLEDMFETLKIAGPIASKAGESMHQLFAITGALGSAGIKGSLAATALKNAYIRLAAPTDAVTAALGKLNLQQSDFIAADGKMKSIVDIMGQIGAASAGLGDAEQLGVFSEIFGKRAVAGATNLSKSLADVESIMQRLEGEQKLKDISDEIRKGLGNQILILKSGLLELGFQFIEAFEKDGRGALQGFIDTVQNIDITPLIKFSKIVVKIFGFVASNWKILLALAGGIKAVAIAMGILNILTQVFNITLKASPIGKIIVIVFLLATAITWLVLNWDKVVEVSVKVWEWMKKLGIAIGTWVVNALRTAGNWIATTGQKMTFLLGPLGMTVSALIEIVKQWGNIKNAFTEGGFIEGIKAIGRVLISSLLAPIQGILELASKIPGVGDLAAGGAAKIARLREGLGMAREFEPKPAPLSLVGKPETPTPTSAPGNENAIRGRSRVDININNQAGENATIRRRGAPPRGTNINFTPAVSY